MTSESPSAIVSAALDGEVVDLHRLQAVLDTENGREAAAAFLLLRASVAVDPLEPRPLGVVPSPDPSPVRRGNVVRMTLVAAGLAAAVLTGFWIGTTRQSDIQAPDGFRSAEAPTSNAAPPVPNRVLRFTPGIDWHPAS